MAYEGLFAETEADFVSRAGALGARLRDAHPSEVLRAALAEFDGRIALVSSFGAESAVLLHMAAEIDPAVPVLFLDTGMLFGQTLDYRQALARRLGLSDVRDLRPQFAELALSDPRADLHRTDPDACCHIRKVLPLDRALQAFDAWITGRKRFHGGERLRLPVIEAADGKIKVNPLANWSRAEIEAYAEANALPAHPLKAFGYPSVGCWPCTQPAGEDQSGRAGRWAGSDKTECGIHLARAPRPVEPPELGGDI